MKVNGGWPIIFVDESNDSFCTFLDFNCWSGGNTIVSDVVCQAKIWVSLSRELFDSNLIVVDRFSSGGIGVYGLRVKERWDR